MKFFPSSFPVGQRVLLLPTLRLPAATPAPAWQSAEAAATVATGSISYGSATAVDAAGNVFLAGVFANSVMLATTKPTCLGNRDVFVARFSPASNRFGWA